MRWIVVAAGITMFSPFLWAAVFFRKIFSLTWKTRTILRAECDSGTKKGRKPWRTPRGRRIDPHRKKDDTKKKKRRKINHARKPIFPTFPRWRQPERPRWDRSELGSRRASTERWNAASCRVLYQIPPRRTRLPTHSGAFPLSVCVGKSRKLSARPPSRKCVPLCREGIAGAKQKQRIVFINEKLRASGVFRLASGCITVRVMMLDAFGWEEHRRKGILHAH